MEEEAVAPVTAVLSTVVHPANVGWVKGRVINTPIVRVNRRLHRCRLEQSRFAVLLLDFLKAFPSVLLESQWEVLRAQGWHADTIRLLKVLHTNMH